MSPFPASSTAQFVWRRVNAFCLVILALAIALLQSGPTLAQSGAVAIQTPQQIFAQPLRSIAEVVRSDQTIRTRNGFGFRKVHVRPQDQIWLVSARDENRCELKTEKLINGDWVDASMADLIQSHSIEQQMTSLVYVHGNRTDEIYARSRGLQFYENIFDGDICSGPIRFVIFAWRSEREKVRAGPDYRIKCERSVTLGPTFANFVNQFEDRRLILAGFSLGGQIVLSGLVQLEAQAAIDPEPKLGQYRVALITPALQARDSLTSVATLPFNSLAAETVVFINNKDIALQAAAVSAKVTKQMPAVTLEQIAQQPVSGTTSKVVIEDMTGEVSRCHSISRYSARSDRLQTIINRMADDLRGPVEVMVPQCEQCQLNSVVEVIEPVEVLTIEPAAK